MAKRKVKAKKVNPRSRPVNLVDLGKIKAEVADDVTMRAWAIFFTVLRDKEGVAAEDLQRIWGEVDELSRSIAEGYCTVSDLRQILKVEDGIVAV